MTIKLLCIDPFEDYDLIDEELLFLYGIRPIFVYQLALIKNLPKNHAVVKSFEYEELLNLCELIKPDFIVSSSEKLFVIIAQIRDKLGIQGMDLTKARLLSHKNIMYEQLGNELPYPTTTKITALATFSSLQSLLHTQEIFIKPVNMSGSYETYHVTNSSEFTCFLDNRKGELDTYIAQAYIEADLYHSELIVFNGKILFVSARKYSLPNHLMVSANLPIFSVPICNADKYKQIIDASIKAQQLLAINNGILHTEFFLSDDGQLHFIETNARPPGIGLNKMYNNKLGISLETLLCFIVCGVTPPSFNEDDNYYICGYYPLKSGLVNKINIPMLDVPSEWVTFVKVNEFIQPASDMSKAGMVLCWDTCYEKLAGVEEILSKHHLIEIKVSSEKLKSLK